jgi:formyl-CoA transferase
MALQRVRLSEHLAGQTPTPMGSATSYIVPDEAFPTKDRPLAVTASSRREWKALCEAIELPQLAEDPRFARNPDRVKNRAVLIPILQEAFRKYSAGFWLDRLQRARVPAALFTSFDEFRFNRHYLENEMLTTFDTPDWGDITVGGVPWRFEKTPGELVPGTPPGADTDKVKTRGWAALGA